MKEPFRIAIVENDAADAECLSRLLDQYFQAKQEEYSLKVYSNAFEFIDEANRYHLVFMDIEMPGISGMEASHKIRESGLPLPLIVFVTNMAQFAIDGYKVSALDFCLKPITYADLYLAMEKARLILKPQEEKFLTVKTKSEVNRIHVSSLILAEMERHDVHLLYTDKNGQEKEMRYRGSMKELEDSFEGTSLIRVNSGCYINLDYFRSYDASDGHCVLANGRHISVSRSNRKNLLTALSRKGL